MQYRAGAAAARCTRVVQPGAGAGGLGKIRIDPPSSSRQGEAAAAVQTLGNLRLLHSRDRVLLPLWSRPRPHVTGGHTMEQ